MEEFPQIQELSVVVIATNQRPNLLNLPFLQGSGVVPDDWELAQQPISTLQSSQVVFRNGLNLSAQENRLTVSESLANKTLEEVNGPGVAQRYVQALPRLEYQAAGINIRKAFTTSDKEAADYILSTLIAPGPWTQFGREPVQAALQFSYALEGRQLLLNVNPGSVQLPDQGTVPVVLFSANVQYPLNGEVGEDRLASLSRILEGWQQDVVVVEELLRTKFLANANLPEAP